jgi:hypothetical protein
MKGLMVLFLVGLLCCGLACSVHGYMSSWDGKHKSQLIEQWGAPTDSGSDGNGGELYVYRFKRQCYVPSTDRLKCYPGQRFSFNQYRLFKIDMEGYIYGWKWKDWTSTP